VTTVSGTISTDGITSAVTGIGTAFGTEFTYSDKIRISGSDYGIDTISSDTAMTVYGIPASVA